MPNAKTADINLVGKPRFIVVGQGGAGKTSQILTLPGRTYAYLFDPSALATLRGHDIEYDMFTPTHVSLAAQSLSKGKGDPKKGKEDASQVYLDWEGDYEKKTASGYWDQFDNIAFDSFTTFSDIVMDRILHLNGRAGQFPQQDDWTAQMQTIMNVVRTFVGMNKLLFCTAHDQFKQDEATSRMQNVILLTGQLRTKVPLLFSDIWHLDGASDAKNIKYNAQTRADRMNPSVRCSVRGIEMYEDVTIKDWTKPQEYGIGRILRDRLGYNPTIKPVPTLDQRPQANAGSTVTSISPGKMAQPVAEDDARKPR